MASPQNASGPERQSTLPRPRLWLVEGHPLGPEWFDAISGAAAGTFACETVPLAAALAALADQREATQPVDLVLASTDQLPPSEPWTLLTDATHRRRGAGLVVLSGGPVDLDAPARDAVTLVPWPLAAPLLLVALRAAARARRLALERLDLWGPYGEIPAGLAGWERAVAAADATLFLCGGAEDLALDLARRVHHQGGRAAGPFAVLEPDEPPAEGLRRALGGTLFVPRIGELPRGDQEELTVLLGGVGRVPPWAGARLVAWATGEVEVSALPAALLYRLNVLRLDLGESMLGTSKPPPAAAVPARLEEVERQHVERVLAECDGNRSEAARRLGMHRATLHTKLRRWMSGAEAGE